MWQYCFPDCILNLRVESSSTKCPVNIDHCHQVNHSITKSHSCLRIVHKWADQRNKSKNHAYWQNDSTFIARSTTLPTKPQTSRRTPQTLSQWPWKSHGSSIIVCPPSLFICTHPRGSDHYLKIIPLAVIFTEISEEGIEKQPVTQNTSSSFALFNRNTCYSCNYH